MEQKPHQPFITVNSSELTFKVQFDDEESELGWGRGELFVGSEHVWFQQDAADEPSPVYWTWVDLLYFLGKNWSFILYEETYPLGLSPIDPRSLRATAEQQWAHGLDRGRVLEEDEAIFRFERRHDLATGLKGISLPSVTIVREGLLTWVCTSEAAHRFSFDAVCSVLRDIGNVIAANIKNSPNPRAMQALHYWNSRETIAQEKLIRLRTGLQEAEIKVLTAGRASSDYWEISAANNDSELLAAARLSTGSVDLASQHIAVEKVRAQPSIHTPKLNQLTTECVNLLDQISGQPFEQGYAVAKWLRGKYPCTGKFDPESLLKQLDVRIESITLSECPLEAIACWGPNHGPAVILNIAADALASTPHGRRSTLAHELGHLLMDREGSLPLAEVLGGLTPEWVEKRARAFAAEVLLPRQLAEQQLDDTGLDKPESIDQSITALSQAFEVSKSLVTHVLWNSGIRHRLSPPAYRRLEIRHKQAAQP
jgi:hypothetical protein